MRHKLVLIGCGNMGFAMLEGWLQKCPSLEIQVVEPVGALRERATQAGVLVVADLNELPRSLTPDLIVLAVKPQMVVPILEKSHDLARAGATFISVAAGVTLSNLAAALPFGTPIIRCMPNTPAAIGEGMTVYCASASVPPEMCGIIEMLLSAVGAVERIEDESLMDAVTAISGSGPAYVFHFVEALIEAGMSLGLSARTAERLAKQTIAGAGHMALTSKAPPSLLREQVTSPHGTTAAAMDVFMTDKRLVTLVREATRAACDRSAALGRSTL